MSAKAMSWAWRQGGLRPAERLVLLCLADNDGGEGLCLAPDLDVAAARSAVSKDTVRRTLKALEAHGLIEAAPVFGEPGFRLNLGVSR